MNECGGSHPNYECSRAVFWTNPSGHKFCREHAIMHEAQLAGGLQLEAIAGAEWDTPWNPGGGGDDTGPRAALTLVIGDTAEQPVHRVGGLLGTLTTEQAMQLAELAETHRLTVREDGQPRLEAVA